MFRHILKRYDYALRKHPLVVKSLTSSAICGGGDIFSQRLIEKTDSFDYYRTIRFTFLGGFLVGPTLHVWYGSLARVFPGQNISQTIKRTLSDQFIFAPVFLCGFISALTVLEGNPELVYRNLEERWAETVAYNWSLWIPAQALNFRFVPTKYQVLCSNITALLWNTYLSWSANRSTQNLKVDSSDS